jgi:predicted porin
MKLYGLPGIGGLFLPALAWAVYAPIPEQEQGKPFTVTIEAGAYHDSNIFGSAAGAIGSMVYSVAPKLAFNASVEKQTFVSASYQATFDYFDNRPTDKSLVSHDAALRLAHKFTQVSNIDLSEAFQVEKNPQSLLAGVPLNADQSFQRNQFDGRLTTALDQKTGVVFKYRNLSFNYDDARLSQNLDRMEHLAGLELNNKFLPEITVVGEYRYQAINYDKVGGMKDKRSNYLLTGVDYALGKQLTLSGRAGVEDRKRAGERGTTAPYAELTWKYDYAEKSFVAAGYTYSLEETDNPALFTDTKLNRFFVNLQHAVTPMVVTSGSITVEPSTLLGRRGLPDISETTTRLGLALTYMARKNFTVSATYDYDRVNSDARDRQQNRTRFGVSGRLYF